MEQEIFSILLKMNIYVFFYLIFGCPMVNCGPFRLGSLNHSVLVTGFLQFQPEHQRDSPNAVRYLNHAKRLIGFETETLRN